MILKTENVGGLCDEEGPCRGMAVKDAGQRGQACTLVTTEHWYPLMMAALVLTDCGQKPGKEKHIWTSKERRLLSSPSSPLYAWPQLVERREVLPVNDHCKCD